MSRTASEILAAITEATGDGSTANGHELFDAAEVPHIEHLHRTYSFESAVRYLMDLRPADAGWVADKTGVEA